ncbi:MAG: hypothetical protein RLZZ28_67 [Bacteroidota bacterium]
MNQKQALTYPAQFAFLLGFMGVFMILSALLTGFLGTVFLQVPYIQVIKEMNLPQHANFARGINTLASFLTFFLPAFILARLLQKNPFSQLGFHANMSSKQVLWVVIITFASMVLSGALGELNEQIPLPANLFKKAKELEEVYKTSMMGMVKMKNNADYGLAILVLAAAPALFEEVLFRGGFQQVFIGWTKKPVTGIIITSVLFSAVHFSYFGFLPRVALGMVLGLIFFYSKNIWLSVLLHFLNNAFIVTQLYAASKKGISIEKTMDESMPIWWGVVALAVLLILFHSFRKESALILATSQTPIDSTPENPLS